MPIHLEFGGHQTERDAVHRLREHLGIHPPQHFVMEFFPVKLRELEAANSEDELLKRARANEGELKWVCAELSSGRFPFIKEGRSVDEYEYKRARLIVGASQLGHRVKVHVEPFSEKAVRLYFRQFQAGSRVRRGQEGEPRRGHRAPSGDAQEQRSVSR